ncbi:BatD family protein [Thermomonas sp.]|uniref:BatD family protein n=1 Tax=Thermomonas sp. TaxID=1971895 RepID=UPI00262438C2|nr:BatD family protein [Thermomonas sp.]MCO5055220.1 BatD family protein [Thermomonas sp.]
MRRAWQAGLWLLLAWLALPVQAQAQTRAWLDRSEIAFGETVALNIETDQSVDAVDYAPLQKQFDVAGQTLRRSLEWNNGRSRSRTLLAVGLRPRAPGVLTIPPLRVGTATTEPLRLVVRPPAALSANAGSDLFVETEVDDARPYVQQSVGVTVRLNYAVPLQSGELTQDPPDNATLQQIGEDRRYTRELDGRRYRVVERHYLLIPERSGTLVIPGARFSGLRDSDMFSSLFGGGGRQDVSVAAPARRLEVRPIPATAIQPWLPLRGLSLRYLRKPVQVRAGEAVQVEIGMTADGATDVQLPALELGNVAGAQIFADPAQTDTRIVDGKLQASVRRVFSLVPNRGGRLTVPGPSVVWWDATVGKARTTQLPPLLLEVAPGNVAMAPAASGPNATASPVLATADETPPSSDRFWPPNPRTVAAGVAGALLLAVLGGLLWRRRAAHHAVVDRDASEPPAPTSLSRALANGDFAKISLALTRQAGLAADDLEAVVARLDEQAQRDAVVLLQSAQWGGGSAIEARKALRAAFAGGARWKDSAPKAAELLPPLYPM